MLALKPYWGKPAVRNFRGDDGDVGIIRSPVRAIFPPDMESRCSAWVQNEAARETEPIGRREVGARSTSSDVGEPAPGDPAEQRSAPMNRLVGGKR
jgi:hypothetical protein